MIIYPAIDLKDGQCVRLVQGLIDNKTVYSNAPASMAKSFEQQGATFLHIVDLDGAFTGSPKNLAAIREIAASITIPFQVGGGLRTLEDVKRILEVGAARVIIGTKALISQDFVQTLLDQFGPGKIVLGLDAKDGYVATEGWVSTSVISAIEFGIEMKAIGVRTAVFTDISRDGVLAGPNLKLIKQVALETGLQVIASGGVSTVENIKELKAIENIGVCGAIIGKALYDGKISLPEALLVASLK